MTHIIVIEDDPAVQKIARKALSKLGGYEVTVTEDAELALNLARSGSVALAVVDVSLDSTYYRGQPIDGLALTRLLKADPASSHVPVLLATAHALPGDAERLQGASGADGYLAKPFAGLEALVDAVRALLAGQV